MNNRVLIAAACIAVGLPLYSPPRAEAEPLTILALAGFATVVIAGSLDMSLGEHHEPNRDMSAQVPKQNEGQEPIRPTMQTENSVDQLLPRAAADESRDRNRLNPGT